MSDGEDLRTLTITIVLPVEVEGDEHWLGLRPVSITASGLTAGEASGLAEGWGQSDVYSIDVTSDIINALDRAGKETT